MDKRKNIRGKLPEKYKVPPKKYYMKYDITKQPTGSDGIYEITAKYFMYSGNILTDSRLLKTEQFEFYKESDFKNKIFRLKKSVDKTIDRFIKELNYIGANTDNVFSIMKQRGF